jgi:hypothetical protein
MKRCPFSTFQGLLPTHLRLGGREGHQTFQKHVKNNGPPMADLHEKLDGTPGEKFRFHLFVSINERVAAI